MKVVLPVPFSPSMTMISESVNWPGWMSRENFPPSKAFAMTGYS